MIELQNIYKKYGNNVLFEDVNVRFDKQKTKLKGENGIGKSVLLKMIVGYSVPDKGTITFENKVLRIDADFLENSGVSINSPQFIPSWTGYDNLKYLAGIRNVCSEVKLQKLLSDFGLSGDQKKKYKTYSLGMCQKMRLIQAIMDDPKYLILDEPFDALDKAAKLKAREIIGSYLNEDHDRMLIYTSHTEDDDEFADEIFEVNNYKVELIH